MFAAFGVGQVLWSLLWFFLFLMWIMLLFNVFGDLFRSQDLSGVAKVVWLLVLIVLPYLGVFAYLILRGGAMAERHEALHRQHEADVREYIRDAAGGGGTASELARLAELRERGLIDDAEFAAGKAKILA